MQWPFDGVHTVVRRRGGQVHEEYAAVCVHVYRGRSIVFTRSHCGTSFSLYSPEVTADRLITHPNIRYIDDNIKAVETGSILSLCASFSVKSPVFCPPYSYAA